MDFNSSSYWENRYISGGTSGDGSYGNLARFKAEVINHIIASKGIESALEFGCGDGNNLGLYNFKRYTGVDVSNKALNICREKYKNDNTKRFIHFAESSSERADITLSLDVIFHLVEDQVFFDHLDHLFNCSRRFVLIYSSCANYHLPALHVRHRNFLKPLADRCPEWRVVDIIANKYPAQDITVQEDGFSFSDFYLFSKAV
jgi:SAM-dependent methyltransferase